jgi:hypothetical protein
MKQILLCVTLATAIASSTLAAYSETVPKTFQQKLSNQKIDGSSLIIPIPPDPIRLKSVTGDSNKWGNSGNIRMLNPQPLPPASKQYTR